MCHPVGIIQSNSAFTTSFTDLDFEAEALEN